MNYDVLTQRATLTFSDGSTVPVLVTDMLVRADKIDVTTFGDSHSQFVSGPTTMTMTVVSCGPMTYGDAVVAESEAIRKVRRAISADSL